MAVNNCAVQAALSVLDAHASVEIALFETNDLARRLRWSQLGAFMPRVLVAFGTTDGHTSKVAHRVGEWLHACSHVVDVVNVAQVSPDPTRYDAVVVAASVHAGKYQRAVTRWVQRNSVALNEQPTAFLSVCLGVLQRDLAVDRDLEKIVDRFLTFTSWQPLETRVVAGALKYTQYNWLKRFLMRRIVRQAHGDTDTSRDYEYTDWEDLRAFVRRFSERMGPTASGVASASTAGSPV